MIFKMHLNFFLFYYDYDLIPLMNSQHCKKSLHSVEKESDNSRHVKYFIYGELLIYPLELPKILTGLS